MDEKKETVAVIIPSRYASTRFPAKALAPLCGRPMVQHVVEKATASQADLVLVATDHELIRDAVESFGGRAVMTAVDHPSGTDRIAEAVSAAERADVAILCLGLNPLIEGEAGDAFNSEAAGDKVSLELPGLQKLLLEKVAAVGKPVILVAVAGSALALPEESAAGVVQCFYPGAEGGTALAEVLSGRVNPSGRLPVTFYRSADDLPPFEDYAMAGRTYRFFGGEVLHPFGFGLSYTEFRYSGLSVPGRIAAGEPLKVAVGVENTGKRAGETVVQLYVAALNPPTRAPQKQLAAVKRISLKPGETRQVELEVKPESFLLTFDDGERKLLPGAWRIEVGHDSRRSAATTEIELI